MNLLTIQLVDDTNNPQPGGGASASYRPAQPGGGSGGAGGGGASGGGSAFGGGAGQRSPGGPAAPAQPYQSAPAGGGDKAAKIQRILSHPAAKGLKLSANILAAMGDAYLDRLDRELGAMDGGGAGGPGSPGTHGGGPQSPKAESARPSAPDPVDEANDWYARYRELQNRFDRYQEEGKRLADVEMAELERLRARLTEEANRPAGGATAGPAGGATAGPAGGPPEDEPGYGRTRFVGNGPDGPLPSWLTDEQRANLPPPGPGYRVVEPKIDWSKFTAAGAFDDLKHMLPGGIGAKFDDIKKGWQTGAKAAVAAGSSELLGAAAGALAGAGPAVAIVVAKLLSDQLASRFQQLERNTLRAGTMLADLAGNNHLGLFEQATDAVSESLAEIPIAGRAVSAGFRLLVAPIKAYETAAKAFVDRANQIAHYDANLASAVAIANLRSTLADVREAQRLGPDAARLINAQSRRETGLREAFLPWKEVVVKRLANIEEKIANAVERVIPLMQVAAEVTDKQLAVMENIPFVLNPTTAGILELVDRLHTLAAKRQEQDELNKLTQDVFLLGEDMPATPFASDPAAGARTAPTMPPIFGGQPAGRK